MITKSEVGLDLMVDHNGMVNSPHFLAFYEKSTVSNRSAHNLTHACTLERFPDSPFQEVTDNELGVQQEKATSLTKFVFQKDHKTQQRHPQQSDEFRLTFRNH